jgi:hypothetical protein
MFHRILGPRIRTRSGIFIAVVAACLLLPYMPARAECSQWSFTNRHSLIQSNGFIVTMDIRQAGDRLSGMGWYFLTDRRGIAQQQIFGDISGTITGNFVTLNTQWKNKSQGIYVGTISSDGHWKGNTYDHRYPRSQASFYSERLISCARRTLGLGKRR